jgi:hypothetical protein
MGIVIIRRVIGPPPGVSDLWYGHRLVETFPEDVLLKVGATSERCTHAPPAGVRESEFPPRHNRRRATDGIRSPQHHEVYPMGDVEV